MNFCPECGAPLEEGKLCRDYFNELLAWDFSDFTGLGSNHHLTVLCYGAQHPSMYSQKGLTDVIGFLKAIIEDHMSKEEMYERNKTMLSSDIREWKIKGTSKDQGLYKFPVRWSMTVVDVFNEGQKQYLSTISKWAQSVYHDLKKSKNIA